MAGVKEGIGLRPERAAVSGFFRELQQAICLELEHADGRASFGEETWEREGGGGGRSRVLEGGAVFEKGGVNFSAVHGRLPDKIMRSFEVDKDEFYATGISLVLHPLHPLVPIVHMNLRYFELEEDRHWFGGGIDLTPHYVDLAEASLFHRGLKEVCDRHDAGFYARFKLWADNYFFIQHRLETRGIGGIFFDKLQAGTSLSSLQLFDFVRDLGHAFTRLYLPMVNNALRPFSVAEKEWQLLRRSRYVEFNLVYDSGTRFGLETNGRTESILMSLPPLASWKHNVQPEAGSPEALTLSYLKKGIDWVGEGLG